MTISLLGVLRRWMECLVPGKIHTHPTSITLISVICSDILYLKTVHYVHTICMTNHLWPAAVVYGEIALPGFREYYGLHSKVVGALLVR